MYIGTRRNDIDVDMIFSSLNVPCAVSDPELYYVIFVIPYRYQE